MKENETKKVVLVLNVQNKYPSENHIVSAVYYGIYIYGE